MFSVISKTGKHLCKDFNAFCNFMALSWTYVCKRVVCSHVMKRVEVRGRVSGNSSTMWGSGIEIRSLGLGASDFTAKPRCNTLLKELSKIEKLHDRFQVFLKGRPVTLKINKVNIPEYCVTRNINTLYIYHSNVCSIAQICKKWCQYAIMYIDGISIKVTVSETSQVISFFFFFF